MTKDSSLDKKDLTLIYRQVPCFKGKNKDKENL